MGECWLHLNLMTRRIDNPRVWSRRVLHIKCGEMTWVYINNLPLISADSAWTWNRTNTIDPPMVADWLWQEVSPQSVVVNKNWLSADSVLSAVLVLKALTLQTNCPCSVISDVGFYHTWTRLKHLIQTKCLISQSGFIVPRLPAALPPSFHFWSNLPPPNLLWTVSG